jgi:hypothetical protein
MVKFSGVLEQFSGMGEKSGWTYLYIPAAVSQKINPGVRKSYRVKGKMNNAPVESVSLMPAGQGNFILIFNARLRKLTGKKAGDKILVQLETDLSPRKPDNDFLICLEEDAVAKKHFKSLTPSHQHYFSSWIA